MTRDLLIKLLDDHGVTYEERTYADGTWSSESYYCDCGVEFPRYHEWSIHVADLILFGFAS